MTTSRKGAVSHLFMAALLSLTVVIIAIYLNGVGNSTIVPAIALINADYQLESAIIMQLQKAHFNPKLTEQHMKKEIMPGVILELKSHAIGNGNWQFTGNITGNQLNKSASATASIANPRE